MADQNYDWISYKLADGVATITFNAPQFGNALGRKRALGTRTPMPGATLPNDRWSLDFASDQLVSGRRFRILAVYDDCTRQRSPMSLCPAAGSRASSIF